MTQADCTMSRNIFCNAMLVNKHITAFLFWYCGRSGTTADWAPAVDTKMNNQLCNMAYISKTSWIAFGKTYITCYIRDVSCSSWQWHRTGIHWFLVRTLQVAPLRCDLGHCSRTVVVTNNCLTYYILLHSYLKDTYIVYIWHTRYNILDINFMY